MTSTSGAVRTIGYWRSEREPDLPDVRDFVDEDAMIGDREEIACRLEAGVLSPWASGGWSTCRICGMRNGSRDLGDGRLIWPGGLAHYVRDHQVRLPDAVESFLRSPPAMSPEEARHAMAEPPGDVEWWLRITQRPSPG